MVGSMESGSRRLVHGRARVSLIPGELCQTRGTGDLPPCWERRAWPSAAGAKDEKDNKVPGAIGVRSCRSVAMGRKIG